MSVFTWSSTAANNGTADTSINWSEGQAPSTVNDSARAMMAALARYFGDISGAITTGGTTTAYTLTSLSGFDTLAHMGGQMIAFVPNQTNAGGGGTPVTLNVDGLGAKPIRFAPNVDIQSGTMVQGTPYVVTYNNSDGAFYFQGFGTNPYQIPVGGLMPYAGATAPNTGFALANGQAISRTIYSVLFALVSSVYGSGDATTTFNVPDLRGRVPFGQDTMGTGAASRITLALSGIVGSSLGASGGAQTVTLSPGNIPALDVNYNQVNVASGAGTTVAQTLANAGAVTGTSAANPSGQTSPSINKMPPALITTYIIRIL